MRYCTTHSKTVQVVVDVGTSLKNPQSKEAADVLRKRVQSFNAIADTIETRIRRARAVIARDLGRVGDNDGDKDTSLIDIPQDALTSQNNSLMDTSDLDLFGDPYLS